MPNPTIRKYLERQETFSRWKLEGHSGRGVRAAVVIPAMGEKDFLPETLDSLARNERELLEKTLVICVINNTAPPTCRRRYLRQNQRMLSRWRKEDLPDLPRFAWVDASSQGLELSEEEGVGHARRIGMDWALRILAHESQTAAPILSLDADAVVESNYLEQVFGFYDASRSQAALLPYAHPVEGRPSAMLPIIQYELHMRCYVLGLRIARSPYAFPAMGSIVTCRAQAYAAVAGMPRRPAGEDFYFLQKLAKVYGIDAIEGTVVQPSGRVSERVPFGTGPAVAALNSGDKRYTRTFHPESFRTLREWLHMVNTHPQESGRALVDQAAEYSADLGRFLDDSGFVSAWYEMRNNSKDNGQLLAQFHRWFDGLKTLRLLHALRDAGLREMPTLEAAPKLMEWAGRPIAPPEQSARGARDLLLMMRRLERGER